MKARSSSGRHKLTVDTSSSSSSSSSSTADHTTTSALRLLEVKACPTPKKLSSAPFSTNQKPPFVF